MQSLSSRIRKFMLTVPLLLSSLGQPDIINATKYLDKPTPHEIVLEKNNEPQEKDENSGIELRLFKAIYKNQTEQDIMVIAKDTKGENVGISEINLYENNKKIHTVTNYRILKRNIRQRKGIRKFYTEIKDKDGNKFRSKTLTLDFRKKQVQKKFLQEHSHHNLKKGYTPSISETSWPKSYDKNALKFDYKDSKIIIPAFYDKRAKCMNCHTAKDLKNKSIFKLQSLEKDLQELWDTKYNPLPKAIVLNPAQVAKITEKDRKELEKIPKDSMTKRNIEYVKRSYQGNSVEGFLNVITDYVTIKIDKPDFLSTLYHEGTHSLQYHTPVKLNKDGKEHISKTQFITEPFAYYLTSLTDPISIFGWMISERGTLGQKDSSNISHVMETLKTYGLYFDVNDPDPRIFSEVLRVQEKKTAKLIVKAFKEYTKNVLPLDTLAIETKSHELPLEAIIAVYFEPIVPKVEQSKLNQGLKKCKNVWEKYVLKQDQINYPLIFELSNSYLAGGRGLKENIDTNIDSLQNIIKRELKKEKFNEKEVLYIYHTFLRNKFSDENGNFSYNPDLRIEKKILTTKIGRCWNSYKRLYVKDKKTLKELEKLPEDTDILYPYVKGTSVEGEWNALVSEYEKLDKMITLLYPSQNKK